MIRNHIISKKTAELFQDYLRKEDKNPLVITVKDKLVMRAALLFIDLTSLPKPYSSEKLVPENVMGFLRRNLTLRCFNEATMCLQLGQFSRHLETWDIKQVIAHAKTIKGIRAKVAMYDLAPIVDKAILESQQRAISAATHRRNKEICNMRAVLNKYGI